CPAVEGCSGRAAVARCIPFQAPPIHLERPSATSLFMQALYHLPGGYRWVRHLPTPRRERLVGEAVGADAGVCPCAAARCASSMSGGVVSARDDTRARHVAWRPVVRGGGCVMVREIARQGACVFSTTPERSRCSGVR